jgi:acetate kinase
MSAATSKILTLNAGSSSIKFAMFEHEAGLARLISGEIERIGTDQSALTMKNATGWREMQSVKAANSAEAVKHILQAVRVQGGVQEISVVGHRLVHGGPQHFKPEMVTVKLLGDLRRLAELDPDHLPREIKLITAVAQLEPHWRQVVCFDTAFHEHMPLVAQWLAIPRRYYSQGVRRYGFHGLSYSYLIQQLARLAGPNAAQGRVVLAHLGSGSSLAAVHGGKSIDTTMGFTPASGVPMGTRSGDLDPGIVDYLARCENMTPAQFQQMVNRESGLLGVSEISADMRDLMAREASDARAAEAVDLYCYGVHKAIGALAAAMNGIDTLVFSGGIGENAPKIRHRICKGLQFIGVVLDDALNNQSAQTISAADASVAVWVIPTDEEQVIAQSVINLLSEKAG